MLGRCDATNVADADRRRLHHHRPRPHRRRPRLAAGDRRREGRHREAGGDGVLVLGETDPDLGRPSPSARRRRDLGARRRLRRGDRPGGRGGRLVDLRTPGAEHDEVFLPVHGAHQADNAAVAVAAAEAFLGRPQDDEVVEEAFAELTAARAASRSCPATPRWSSTRPTTPTAPRSRPPPSPRTSPSPGRCCSSSGCSRAATRGGARGLRSGRGRDGRRLLARLAPGHPVGRAGRRRPAPRRGGRVGARPRRCPPPRARGGHRGRPRARHRISVRRRPRAGRPAGPGRSHDPLRHPRPRPPPRQRHLLVRVGPQVQALPRPSYERIRPGTVAPAPRSRRHRPAALRSPRRQEPTRRPRRPGRRDLDAMRRTGRDAAEVLRDGRRRRRPRRHHRRARPPLPRGLPRRRRLPEPPQLQRPFPKSICTSVNEVICHGIPDSRALRDGDIVNLDVTLFREGVHGDTNATFLVGTVDDRAARLVRVTRECLEKGIDGGPARPAHRATSAGRSRTTPRPRASASCGPSPATASAHEFHTGLHIPHYYEPRDATRLMEPGMTFTIEPMIALGDVAAPDLGRRLDRGHRRRPPHRPVRAHPGGHRRRRRDPHPPPRRRLVRRLTSEVRRRLRTPSLRIERRLELAGVGRQAQGHAADRFEGPLGDHGVLGGDVHVAEHPLQRARLVDRRTAARRGTSGPPRRPRPRPRWWPPGGGCAGRRRSPRPTRSPARPHLSTKARADRHAASLRATSTCTADRSASVRALPIGRFAPASSTSSAWARRARPSVTDATPSASIPRNGRR